ncbi:RagB/SusD family nutrient uptake outer membrane protein [Sphingobacterium sp.]|uniref:RagB/SusD family nutrient uptake outer membrane protein n=1 Tax=Sphingobacterium sp. TaxID=341027 RepID=UPI002FDE5F7D
MKKSIYIILLATAFYTVSCNKFLDIVPKTQVPQDQQFDTEQGFKDALTGVYINLKNERTYGKELSFATIENLVSSWDVTNNTLEQQLGLYNYSDSKVIDKFNLIFSQQYTTIAHINAILQQIDSKKSILKTAGIYEIIKGECLGLRAFVHLDLMRLYGPIPQNPAVGNELAYVTEFGRNINAHVSFDAYKEQLLNDIKQAGELIKSVDPMLHYSMADIRNANGYGSAFKPDDNFIAYRNMRMNYYAIKALEARANLWYGDNEKAYNAAKEVIQARNENDVQKFPLASGVDYTATNFMLTTEQIFGLYVYNMATTYTNYFGNATYRKGTTSTTVTNQLYGNTGTDFREATLWNLLTMTNGSKYNVIKKYLTNESNVTVNTDYKQIPLLRTSELYLILAETAPFNEGLEYFKQFRLARNIGSLATPQDKSSLIAEIIKEYRKEFYAEGQAFYAYKRLSVPKAQVLFAPSAALINYILPMPTAESSN